MFKKLVTTTAFALLSTAAIAMEPASDAASATSASKMDASTATANTGMGSSAMDKQLENSLAVFDKMDADKDGSVSKSEFKDAMQKVLMAREAAAATTPGTAAGSMAPASSGADAAK